MGPLEIAAQLQKQFPDEIVDVKRFQGQVGVVVRRERIVNILRWLRDSSELRMNHLKDLCGVDNRERDMTNLERFEVVYNLYSIPLRCGIRLRAQIPESDPCIDTATVLWSGANWHERECFDLMGISFTGHPDLRRILLPEDWEGHPLRKEYPLRGDVEWRGMEELRHKVEQLKQYDFKADSTRPADSPQSEK